MNKIPLGISGCLLDQPGEKEVANRDSLISEVIESFFEWKPFSAEEEKSLLIQEASAISDSGTDKMAGICGYIMKRPEQAVTKTGGAIEGLAIETLRIMHRFPLVPIEESIRLQDPCLRDLFFKRVYVMYRWQRLLKEGLSARALIDFHARHKLIIMSHGDYRDLGQLLAGLNKDNLTEIAYQYILQLMSMLLTMPTRANHVNVLQHIQGHLKKDISRDDKAELCELIDSYRNYEVPLIAPIILLKHHFRKSPDPYIQSSYYFSPYPSALGSVNP
ncbi:YbgA family protein [Methylotuvimicrobium sp.]|uniref:YbgA family protein n=1 Tax=Methylotuvimicrobium sp. TaxID=2822413 RepID=UPI003D65B135